MTRRVVITALLAVLLGSGAVAQRAPRFGHERPVNIATPGPQRLDIDASLLAGAQPFSVTSRGERHIATGGLGDLRLFTPENVEVPYLLIAPPVAEPAWIAGRVLPIAATEKTSGIEADFGDVVPIDAFRLTGIRPPYLKRFSLEGSGDRERWTLLVAEGTAFDLPGERLTQSWIGFTPGEYRYLRVTWDDTNSGRVAPPSSFLARRVMQLPLPSPALRTPLVFERRSSEPGVSRFRIRLPAARLPIVAIDLSVGGGHLLRNARIVEPRLAGDRAEPDTIGRAMLRRVVRDGLAAEALRIAIRPPHEAELDLVVDDGDNPPLDLHAVAAVFAELPWIYFESTAAMLTARWGDLQLDAPQYDLEAARAQVSSAAVARATWGEPHALAVREAPAPLPMPATGSAIDAKSFRYSRTIAQGAHGLVTVPLDAAALAHSGSVQNGFADVRVLDDTGQQIPYLVERRDGPLTLDVTLERRELPANIARRQKQLTTYAVSLPYRRLPEARLALTTRARVFQRSVQLALLEPPTERRREPALEVLSTSTWVHADQDRPAAALVLHVPEERSGDLLLLVDEGDNQPLPLARATLLLPSYAIRLFRPEQARLRLVYGRDDLQVPRYDIALLAPQLLGRVAEEVHADREEQGGAAAGAAATIVSPTVFWAALGLAVIVLLALVVRLARGADPNEPGVAAPSA